MNNEPTTKQRPSASMLRPSRLCQILFVALILKVGVLGGLAYESLMYGSGSGESGIAHAADSAKASTGAPGAPAAPQNIQAPLSGAAMADIEGAGGQTGTTQKNDDRALPAIGTKRGVGAGDAGNAGNGNASPEGMQAGVSGGGGGGIDREALIRRQDELSRKEEELKILEQEISQKIEDLNVLETRLQIMMREAEGTRDEKLRHLVDVLSNMKARQAAAVLETLELRIGVKILANMRGRQAGEILTFVDPQKAASLAEALSRMQMPLE